MDNKSEGLDAPEVLEATPGLAVEPEEIITVGAYTRSRRRPTETQSVSEERLRASLRVIGRTAQMVEDARTLRDEATTLGDAGLKRATIEHLDACMKLDAAVRSRSLRLADL